MNATFETGAELKLPRHLSQTNGLRLVGGMASRKDRLPTVTEIPAKSCLVLVSAMGDKDIIGSDELTALFQSLKQGERIEFVHTLYRDAAGNALEDRPYRLQVRVAAALDRTEDLRERVSGVVASAFPSLHFEEDRAFPLDEMGYVAQFAPAGVRITTKPGYSTMATDASGVLPSESWPYPHSLPNWPFRAPLRQPLDLPPSTEVSIRIHGFSLVAEQCAALNRTLLRLQSGGLAAFHPESPVTPFSAAAELQEAVIPLAKRWLRHPSGWAVDCVVKSSEPLGTVASQLIPKSVFGERPFVQAVSGISRDGLTLAEPTLAWAIAEGQGIPPLMPAQSVLGTLGVSRHFPAPLAPPPRSGSWLGESVCGRRSSPVFLPFECRSRHVALFGATGSGKSSLMTQMMASDIADPERRCGIGLIDPHGSLYQRVLELIPRERADDVILVDTSDPTCTASLNPLEGLKDDPVQASFIVSEIMSLIEMLFEGKDTAGPTTRAHLRHLLLLTAGTYGREPCLMDAVRVLEDTDYAEYVISKCKDRSVAAYWSNFMKTQSSHTGYAEWGPFITSRLSHFKESPIMKRLINRPKSTIHLAKAMREKKIVLFNLNKGVLQDTEVQILGSLILMKFFSAALGRARIPEAERAPFHLYVDEFQTFATDSVPRMFSEARKFGLCLTTANQSLNQLENRWGRSNIAESILANAATKFMFRLGPTDISTLEPYFRPQFDAGTMSTLPDFHAVACMADKNRPLPPFVMRANLATPEAGRAVSASELVETSRRRYTVSIEQANAELVEFFNLDASTLSSSAGNKDCSRAETKDVNKTLAGSVVHEVVRVDCPPARWTATTPAPKTRPTLRLNADGGQNRSGHGASGASTTAQ